MSRTTVTPLDVAASSLAFRFRPRIVHLILHVTSRCPGKCRTCFVKKGADDLPRERILEIAHSLPGLLWLDIGGGEPFLRDDLPEICAAFPVPDLALPTGGYDPDRIVGMTREIRRAFKGDLTVGVSLDGFRETNDSLRGEGAFEGSLETVRRLREIDGLIVKVNTVVCRDNFAQLPEFMEYIKELGIAYHSLLLLRGKPADEGVALPAVTELRQAGDRLFEILDGYPYLGEGWKRKLAGSYHRLMWEYSLQALEKSGEPPACLAGRGHLVVYADGDAAPCELTPPVGNVHTESIETILAGGRMQRRTAEIRAKGCSCTHNCNMMENILFDFRSWPRLLRGAFRG